jgi:photosystem II stability/assembly factor-like uncharacterized protein
MKYFYKLTPLLILVFAFQVLNGQPWIENVKSEKPTFHEIQNAFYDYWKDKTIEKGKGYKPFKRWEWYWEPRILPNGEFPSPSVTWDAWQDYIKTHPEATNKIASDANWSFIGPSTTPGGYNGLGRINCIAFHPTIANTFWVGTPAGGLWKTTNGGSTWTTNTDNLPVLGVSDIAVDYTDPNIIYIATGDGDRGSLSGMTGGLSGDTKSIGILKSTDGGNTWNTTGMNWSVTSAKLIRRLVMNPIYPTELLAATSDGIYRTLDGGTTWTQVQAGYFMDVEFKPNNSDTAYAATYAYGNAKIYRSTNFGTSWTTVATLPNVLRINLAVTPDWPELVDALCANTSGGLAGLWYSNNSGADFSQYFTSNNSNNLLNSSYNASGAGGQGHYDLAYAINPINSGDIWLGGVNTWNSTNGGSNWNLKTIWSGGQPTSAAIVHADKHFIAFHPLVSGTMFECNDGGLYKTTNGGSSWTDLSNGLQISQMYRLGVSQTIANNVICGVQDNGTRELYNNTWYQPSAIGGDGMECLMDYSNSNIEYATYAYGRLTRTYDFWATTTVISDNIPGMTNFVNTYGQESGGWVTPFVIHPTNPQTLYAGYHNVWKTTDRGDSWSQISNFGIGLATNLRSIAVAPSNPSTIFAATYDTLYLTTNGGTNWNYVPLGIPNAKISYIAFDPNNSQNVYITLSGYSAGNKVYMSPDAGNNWYNYSGTLPNVPVNCIVYQTGTNEGLYVGTDVGVFYTDGSMSDWIPYDNGLPNVVVTELEISYNDGKLWAATFGRGLWNSDLNTLAVGIEEENTSNEVLIFPNPNNGQFTIQVYEDSKYDVSVTNVLGETILTENEITTVQKTIDLSIESSGLYIVRIKLSDKIILKKVIINN